jgi:regulatory protein
MVAFDLLARKPWTRRELRRRLQRRGAPAEVAETVVADLETRGYVDDRAFAATWVETRSGGRGLGARRLREELRTRGVDRAVIETALAGAGGAEDEAVRARALAARRLPALQRAAPDRVARRLHDYLLRRGFGAGVVRRVVESVVPAPGGLDD